VRVVTPPAFRQERQACQGETGAGANDGALHCTLHCTALCIAMCTALDTELFTLSCPALCAALCTVLHCTGTAAGAKCVFHYTGSDGLQVQCTPYSAVLCCAVRSAVQCSVECTVYSAAKVYSAVQCSAALYRACSPACGCCWPCPACSTSSGSSGSAASPARSRSGHSPSWGGAVPLVQQCSVIHCTALLCTALHLCTALDTAVLNCPPSPPFPLSSLSSLSSGPPRPRKQLTRRAGTAIG
jgi:hypothetical protein